MQTFVPLTDLKDNFECLDYRRLGKQRVEAMQILNCLTRKSSGWRHHPATLMWADNIPALKMYLRLCILEWLKRGYKNNIVIPGMSECSMKMPDWWGGPIHKSHRAALLYKNSEWYSQFGWSEKPEINYVWPQKLHKHKDPITSIGTI